MIHNLGNQFYKFRPVIGELPDQGVSSYKFDISSLRLPTLKQKFLFECNNIDIFQRWPRWRKWPSFVSFQSLQPKRGPNKRIHYRHNNWRN